MVSNSSIIHIEPSSRCTLACPQCPRTTNLGEYTIEDCDIPSMVKACSGYSVVMMCGNHGDPIYHQRFHDLVRSLRQDNPSVALYIHTNGAFRSEGWWETTASLLHAGDRVIFGIDGLPRNNHIYRINSRWDSVETGIRTLRRGSPDLSMIWKWIVFGYNQEDVIEGMRMARELGFNVFTTVHSARYGDDDGLSPTKGYDEITGDIREWVASHLGV